LPKDLDNKEKIFVNEYLVDLNPERAAIAAGYAKTTAAKKSWGWVGNGGVNKRSKDFKPHVYEAVQNALKLRAIRTQVTQDRVLFEYTKIAYSNAKDFFDTDGLLIPIQNLPDDTAAAISHIEVAEGKGDNALAGTTTKIKLVDKKGALDSLARHLGMFNDKLGLGRIGADGEITEIPIVFLDAPVREE